MSFHPVAFATVCSRSLQANLDCTRLAVCASQLVFCRLTPRLSPPVDCCSRSNRFYVCRTSALVNSIFGLRQTSFCLSPLLRAVISWCLSSARTCALLHSQHLQDFRPVSPFELLFACAPRGPRRRKLHADTCPALAKQSHQLSSSADLRRWM